MKNKTRLINLFGPPCSGKTLTSAELFSALKRKRKKVELVSEWCKKLAWDGTEINKYMQPYILGKECVNQTRLINKVNYIISDSPVFLSAFYHYYYNNSKVLKEVAKEITEYVKEDNVEIYNFFFNTYTEHYEQEGRYQTLEESRKIGIMIREWLEESEQEYTYIENTDLTERCKTILEIIV